MALNFKIVLIIYLSIKRNKEFNNIFKILSINKIIDI